MVELFLILKIALTSAAIVYVLKDTDAVEAYLKLFRFKGDVIAPSLDNPMANLSFGMRLSLTYPDSFWVKLFNCSTCLSVWVAGAIGAVVFKWGLISIGSSIFFTWVAYNLLRVIVTFASRYESDNSREI